MACNGPKWLSTLYASLYCLYNVWLTQNTRLRDFVGSGSSHIREKKRTNPCVASTTKTLIKHVGFVVLLMTAYNL